ncbi:MAG: hypothetical protein HOQ05_13020 [Corynebacteriales bacterium]|nr:hypothetical protein [Mycobacteriales bacterium]
MFITGVLPTESIQKMQALAGGVGEIYCLVSTVNFCMYPGETMSGMTTVKVTKELRDRLAALARAEGRTMVAELRALLLRREYELGRSKTSEANRQ